MTIQFFLPMVPPTITQQEHRLGVSRKGKAYVYDPPELREARQKFTALLRGQWERFQAAPNGEPLLPLEGPLRLTTKWIWPNSGGAPDGAWKPTRPDTDNLIKLFKDCLTRAGWWLDDAQVCSEITEKFWGRTPGIFVKVEEL